MNRWHNEWYLMAILIILGMLAYIMWNLSLNPQYVLVFLTTTIIALGFVVLMALLPKYRRRIINRALEYQAREREMGKEFYRYYKMALVVIILCALILPVVLQYQLIFSHYLPLFVFAFFIVNLVAGVIFIAGFLKARGKWRLLLVFIIFASALLGILIRWITKHI